jgi:hypothetical protein
MDFDKRFLVPAPVPTAGPALTYARRGTKIVIAATQDDRIQVQKLWTGPSKKEECYVYPVAEATVAREKWLETLKSEGYKVRAE